MLLAGEAHNSDSSSLAAMEPVWERAQALCLNTLLLPVTWELVEPEEGHFDFELVDGLVFEARKRGFRLGLLWFGAWKNGQCTYAPAWVKTNLSRFRRAEVRKGARKVWLDMFNGLEYSTLSCFCQETRAADARAFAALMAHLRETDQEEQTVVYVQVENEAGILGAAREHSDEADKLFAGAVPPAFAQYMRANIDTMREDVRAAVEAGAPAGSWNEVFGNQAEEIFQAYHVASYIDAAAAAGKAAYDIPMAVNAWLEQGPAGSYPAGGPVAKMMEVYKFAAPHIDVVCPDIYVPNFCQVCDSYCRPNNPLLIPETAIHSLAGPRLVYAIGHYHAWGFAPFGFDGIGQPMSAMAALGMDESDPLLCTPQDGEEYAWYNRTLASLAPLLAKAYGTSRLQAVSCERNGDMAFGGFAFRAVMDPSAVTRRDGVCLVLQVAEDAFYLIANGCMLEAHSTDPARPYVDILDLEEGSFVDGEWQRYRRLNGDESFLLRYEKPVLLRLRLFAYA